MAKTIGLKLQVSFSAQFYYTCQAHRCHWPLLFYTSLIGLDLSQGSKGQQKAEPAQFIFMHSSQLSRLEFEFQFLFPLKMTDIVALGKAHTRSTLSVSSVPKVALETASVCQVRQGPLPTWGRGGGGGGEGDGGCVLSPLPSISGRLRCDALVCPCELFLMLDGMTMCTRMM